MISITITPTTVPQAAIVSEMMMRLIDTLAIPTAQVAIPADMAKAIAHAETIKTEKESAATAAPKQAKPKKAEAPAATQPAPSASDTPQPEPGATAEPATESPSEPVQEAAPAAPEPGQIDYSVVAKAITETARSDRSKVVAALAKYGIKNGTGLKPEQYAEFLQELA